VISPKYFISILFILLGIHNCQAEDIEISANTRSVIQPKNVYYSLYYNTKESVEKEIPLPFIQASSGIHSISIDLNIKTSENAYSIEFPFLNCEKIKCFATNDKGDIVDLAYSKNNNNFIFSLKSLGTGKFRINWKIESTYSIFLPLKITNEEALLDTQKRDILLYAMYFGIVIIMSLYNLFIYFSTKNISYLYYVIYTISFGSAQFALLGFFNAFIAPDNFILSKQVGVVFSGISGIFGIFFFNSFLDSKNHIKFIRKLLLGFAVSYGFVILIGFAKVFTPAFNLLNINAISVGLISLGGSAYLAFKKNRPARFFVISWLAFMVGLVVFVLTNIGVAPYNSFTKFVLPLSSVIEITLLSFALADKINILSKENETLIREQNIVLERQVIERTAQLVATNENLKDTQAQLVNSEKMASLGHLTAGIAHEINNPINFISANISPLRRDIEDYEIFVQKFNEVTEENQLEKVKEMQTLSKELDMPFLKTEIEMLLKGIDEGARRTAEIVKNLKIFSHIDKAENSYYSLNDGIQSTLHLLSHKLDIIKVETNLQELPPILCYPGKLNQIFMNILSNAVDALSAVNNAKITVNSYLLNDNIVIEFLDNGHGIPKEIQKDIFNPFFTTKEVGSGTGLGLSITLSLVHEHGGDITVISDLDQGCKFTITIPVKL